MAFLGSMVDIYNYNFHVECSRVDNTANLSFDGIFDIIQIAGTEFLAINRYDNINMKKKYDSAWVITKAKVKINKLPSWGSELKLKSYVVGMKSAKIDIEVCAYDDKDNLLFVAIDEYCPIDLRTRRIKRIREIEFDDIKVHDSILGPGYNIISFNNPILKDKFKVKFCDIDFTNHTNNVSYIRFIMNYLSRDFFNNNDVINVDIHYLNESLLNDELSIYEERIDNKINLLIKKEDINVFSIRMEYNHK